MTKFSRVALYVLMGAVFTVPYIVPAYAEDEMAEDAVEGAEEGVLSLEEAEDLIMSQPTSKDAVSGVVPVEPAVKPYDLYSRQMAYREHAKDLRASLDQRRVNYDEPRTALLEKYRDLQEKVFAAETAAYQAEISAEDSEEEVMNEDDVPEVTDTSDAGQKDMAEEKTASADDGEGLTEKPIPAQPGAEDEPKKKVVTTEDAPDFDPSNL